MGDTGSAAFPEGMRIYFYVSFGVDVWSLYLHLRQLEYILFAKHIPDVIQGTMSQSDYDWARVHAVFLMVVTVLILTVRLHEKFKSTVDIGPSLIWSNTKMYAHDNESRVIIYSAIDDFLTKSILLPIFIVLATVKKDLKLNPLSVAIFGIVWLFSSAAMVALHTALMIHGTNERGKKFFLHMAIFSEAAIFLGHIIFIQMVAPRILPRLPNGQAKNNIDKIALQVGYYPKHGIYLDSNEDPNAYHVGIFGTSMIAVSETLLNIVGPVDVPAVVAHELGHWKYCHSYYGFLANLVRNVCFLLTSTWAYGNPNVYNYFNLDPSDPPHPVMGVLLFSKYIFPSLDRVIYGFHSVVGYSCEYTADRFAAGLSLQRNLRNSLVKLISKLKLFPGADHWYAAWFHSHPSMVRRIERLH